MQLPKTRTLGKLVSLAENTLPVVEDSKENALQEVDAKERYAVVVLHGSQHAFVQVVTYLPERRSLLLGQEQRREAPKVLPQKSREPLYPVRYSAGIGEFCQAERSWTQLLPEVASNQKSLPPRQSKHPEKSQPVTTREASRRATTRDDGYAATRGAEGNGRVVTGPTVAPSPSCAVVEDAAHAVGGRTCLGTATTPTLRRRRTPVVSIGVAAPTGRPRRPAVGEGSRPS